MNHSTGRGAGATTFRNSRVRLNDSCFGAFRHGGARQQGDGRRRCRFTMSAGRMWRARLPYGSCLPYETQKTRKTVKRARRKAPTGGLQPRRWTARAGIGAGSSTLPQRVHKCYSASCSTATSPCASGAEQRLFPAPIFGAFASLNGPGTRGLRDVILLGFFKCRRHWWRSSSQGHSRSAASSLVRSGVSSTGGAAALSLAAELS